MHRVNIKLAADYSDNVIDYILSLLGRLVWTCKERFNSIYLINLSQYVHTCIQKNGDLGSYSLDPVIKH